MSFEAYKVAVRLSLIDGVSTGLVGILGHFNTLNKRLDDSTRKLSDLEKSLARLGKMTLVGGAMAAAGGFGLSILKGPLEEAKQYQLEIEKFRALGVGDAVTKDAEKFASGMKTYGTSIRENLGLLRDAQTIFGDFEHAKFVTPLLAQMKFANAAMYGSEGGAMKDRSFMDMLKVIELRKGLSSEEAFRAQANMVQQVQTATGGRVGANEYLNLIKTGGVAAKSIADDVFYYKLEPLIQEMGGNRIGTGLMSAYNNLILGRTTVQSAKELQRLGMLDEKHIEYNKIGMIKRILPGGLKGGDEMMRDPIAFLENVMLPAFAKNGITGEQDILRELGLVFSNRTASQLFSTIFLQMANIKKNESLNRGAMGIDQLDETARNTAVGKEMNLHKKWADVLNVLGTTILPIAIKAVEGLTKIVEKVIAFGKEFPTITKGLVVGFAVLSGLVAAGGAITLVTAGFKALGLVLGATGAAGAAGGLGTALLALSRGVAVLATTVMTNPYVLAITGAAAVGYGIGSLINKALPDSANMSIGRGIAKTLAFFGNDDAKESLSLENKYVRSQRQGGAGGGDVYLDREKVGKIMRRDLAKELSKAQTGANRPDWRMNLMPVGVPSK